MAGEENQKPELVHVSTTQILGQQALVRIQKKHVLSASFLEQINENYVPFYGLTQQPTMMLRPFDLIRSEVIPANLPIANYRTISTNTEIQNQEDDDEDEVIDAVPISWSAPTGYVPNFCMNNENQIIIRQEADQASSERSSEASQIPFQERKVNWIIRRLPRSKGNRFDPYYVHLKTDVQFRSLVAVHNFIVNGLLPQRRKTKKDHEIIENNINATISSSNIEGSRPHKIRGDKLLNRIEVGQYNLTTGQIMRNKNPPVEGNCSSALIGTAGSTKRKREEEEGVSKVAKEAPQLMFTLNDFEPIN